MFIIGYLIWTLATAHAVVVPISGVAVAIVADTVVDAAIVINSRNHKE